MKRWFGRQRQRHVAAGLLALLAASPLAAQDEEWAGDWDDDPWGEEASAFSWYGFVEGAGAWRTRSNPAIGDDMTLEELRLQLEGEYRADWGTVSVKADGVADGVEGEFTGEVREAMVNFSPAERLDVRLGRQVLTWGTGDLLFLNDLFPKDWQSFLAGRDDDYLKAPSDAARFSWYGEAINLDVVVTPHFEPDRYVDGSRLSYYDPARGTVVGAPPALAADAPSRTVDNAELALRLYGLAGAQEWALYAYRGFFGQPTAFDPERGVATFARLNSLGVSLRGPFKGGIYHLETAWYDSADDRDGNDPDVPNGELRLLVGYERKMATSFTVGTQYYLEWLQHYDDYATSHPFAADARRDELRHLVTLRLSYRMLRDNLVLGVMNFYSPSDEDAFLRPTVTWRYSDNLQFNAGANLFTGQRDSTFYGQFEANSNVFLRARYSF
ncbi:hypothetical protein [Billgrantia endophytica]|uniref:DUF1302 domain-containing protein n=1 Tax=Billgrantia endophytica TaxID=2033802 RepID=A0A2N7TYA0_9GAMM|nr:hypothetical protein [Halomonas endophytica]PMR73174.1 hypothetical protein C1H69_17665 [Halomonas endophytica]